MSMSPKGNGKVWQEIDLVSFDAAAQYVNHYATGSSNTTYINNIYWKLQYLTKKFYYIVTWNHIFILKIS